MDNCVFENTYKVENECIFNIEIVLLKNLFELTRTLCKRFDEKANILPVLGLS